MGNEQDLLQKRFIDLSKQANRKGIVIYSDFLNLSEQNLLSDTAVTFKVYDGTAQVAVMMANFLQVPTKQGLSLIHI